MSRRAGSAVPRERDAVPVFVALGDATRLRLLRRLSSEGPLSIARLSEGTGVTRQAITRHLYALDEAGLVGHVRRGREQVWELNAKRLEIARQYLEHVAAQWDAAAARLRAFVENEEESE
jgi:DNA-binding transcriptional ArsR family regulator